ncbi:50S ribosomal protein L24 [Candidatus Altiarchaeota archaeon]
MKKPTNSKQPRKQRKWRYKAPLHVRGSIISATLDPELRKKYKRRSMNIRKGDIVKVLRGTPKKMSGEVTRVSRKKYKVYVDGINIKKADGTEVQRALDPSNLMITELYIEDKERRDVLERNIKKE